MSNIINTAPCRFCGQMVQIDSEEKLTQPQAEEQATMSCTCEQAVEYQKEKQRKEKAMQNVAALFGEAAAPEKRCSEGIVNILKAAVEEIYTGGLPKPRRRLGFGRFGRTFLNHGELRRVSDYGKERFRTAVSRRDAAASDFV